MKPEQPTTTAVAEGARRGARRVVTGHDNAGRSIVQEDRQSPFVLASSGGKGPFVIDLWKTHASPADNQSGEPCTHDITLAPPARGSLLRIVEFPPDRSYMDGWNPNDTFEALGHALDVGTKAHRTPGMHKTRSLDYAIVLAGEIWAVMDQGETLLKAGDVLIQRGTNHGWSNRSDHPARVAFVLIGAEPLKGAAAG
ncbi:MAG: hypothetical protein JWP41_2132 [Ramlibacter sp.]|nr:hypothetical protein [Ramlibacter sp.]